MIEKISLKHAEHKIIKSTFKDGLWDILIGSFFLQFAIAPLLSGQFGDFWSSAIFLPFWALVFIFIRLIRKFVILPRIGIVKFGSFRKRKITKLTIVMLFLNIIVFCIGIFFLFKVYSVPGWIHSAIFGFVILIMSSIAAHFLVFTRLFVYGMLFFLSLVTGESLYLFFKIPHHAFPFTFGVSASIIIITGLVLFLRFLKNHPIPIKGSVSGEEME